MLEQPPRKPSYQRILDEEAHFEDLLQSFTVPISIPPETYSYKTQSTSYTLNLPQLSPNPGNTTTNSTPLFQIPTPAALEFTTKDCAIYGNYTCSSLSPSNANSINNNKNSVPEAHRLSLLAQIYKEWYPHRSFNLDIHSGVFFAQYMQFAPPVFQLSTIINFHSALCSSVKDVLGGRNAKEPLDRARYLRKTFPVVFIVVGDEGWRWSACSSNSGKGKGQGEGDVLLVWKTGNVAKRYGCWEGEAGMKAYVSGDGSDLRGAKVFRCTLRDVMRAVVGLDEERSKKRREYSAVFGEVLGDDEDIVEGE